GTSTTTTNTFSAGSPAPLNTSLNAASNLPGINLGGTTLTTGGDGGDGVFAVGDTPSITFSLDTINKAIVPGSGMPEKSSIAIGDLTYGEIFLSGPSSNYQRVIAKRTDLTTASVRNADGTYTYTLPALPATYLAPLNDTAAFTDGELTGTALVAGRYTIGIAVYKEYTVGTQTVKDVANVLIDIPVGSATALADMPAREVVTTANCNRCHQTLQAHDAYDGKRRDVRLCVLCHTSGAEDSADPLVTPGVTTDFRVMIHKIHNGSHLPSVNGVTVTALGVKDYTTVAAVPYEIDNDGVQKDFSVVNFPVMPSFNVSMPRDLGYSNLSSAAKTKETAILRGVVACDKCHGDPDGAGALTAPAQGTLHRIPSKRACGSCHDDIDWTRPYQSNGLTMAANQADGTCATCHAATGAATPGNPPSVEYAHTHPAFNSSAAIYATANPGLNFAITDIKDATATNLVSTAAANGDVVDITYTLKNDAGTDLSLASIDAASIVLTGPSTNPQPVTPIVGTGSSAISPSPYDFSGRLASSSTTNKGTMSKVVNAADKEVLVVQFSSGTAFTVIGIDPATGLVDADWTGGAAIAGTSFPAATSVNKSGNTVSAITLTTAAIQQTITVGFTSATAFTVTGSVTGAMGSGTLPNTVDGKSASTYFTSNDGTVSFIVASGTTAYIAGDNVYLSVFKGPAGNPAIFAMVAGRTAFAANDIFHYETVPSAAAASYTIRVPMDLTLEYLGDGATGLVGEAFTAANLPVYFGRQTLWERTAVAGAVQAIADWPVATGAADPTPEYGAYVIVGTVDAAWAANDYVVIDDGTANLEEYVQIGAIDTAQKRVWFVQPLRYAHAVGATIQEVTLTLLKEGVDYSLNPTTGVVTTGGTAANPVTAGNALVMTYRADAKFGWKRHNVGVGGWVADTAQTEYYATIRGTPGMGEDWGKWTGLSYQSGTYTVAIWGSKNIDVALQNEVQTYRGAGIASRGDFLYGTATSIVTHQLISDPENCNACHGNLAFHGASRRGFNTCVNCHSMAGQERYTYGNSSGSVAGGLEGVSVDFRTMLHKIHMGEELTNASTYQGGSFAEVVFPAMPGKAKHCEACHGAGSTTWHEPSVRTHASQTTPTRRWQAVCTSCHDSTDAQAMVDLYTSAAGNEACGTCHAPGATDGVDVKHKSR
ncbi:MAG: hypothetical protein HYY93_12450, partial [Planctomycetes bacterium]|nr:hypothetical protein [Planctomycetota bacterium]